MGISAKTTTYTGQRLDPESGLYHFHFRQYPESGLYHFHFRQYDAGAGVWITPDPIGILGGLNLYQYAGSNPVNLVDWLGLVSAGELVLVIQVLTAVKTPKRA